MLKKPLKAVSCALCAALVLLSPGAAPYEALAASSRAAGASGLPAGGAWSPYLQSLSQPQSAARFSALTLNGIGVAGLLRELSAVDLNSSEGRAAVAPVFDRLSVLEVPSAEAADLEVLRSMTAAAAASRARAFGVASRIEKGAGAGEAESISEGLAEARRVWPLLGEGERRNILTQGAAYARRLEAAREERAAGMVRSVVAGWGTDTDEPLLVSGRTGTKPRQLSRAEAREGSYKRVLPVPSAIKTASRSGTWRALGALFAMISALTIPGAAPVLTLTAGLVGSILLHETAHLWMLRRLGEDTAARNGFPTLNPLKLLDPVGSVLLPVATALVSTALLGVPVLFGWAKPIPVDFNNLPNPKRDAGKVALAGPAMNLALAAVAFAALAVLSPFHAVGAVGAGMLLSFAKINAALAAFNMLPLPQLDGGKVLVSLLPESLYSRWVRNQNIPAAYRHTFERLYEGPSSLLNWLGLSDQRAVNWWTRGITLGAFALFSAAGYLWLGAPLLMLMLVCSYDYRCIREKIQNEKAVEELIGLLQGFSNALALAAEQDDSIQSTVNAEKVEHSLKQALEDSLDKVVDSAGFNGLSPQEKWDLFERAYQDAAVSALGKEGLSRDTPETIRRLLESAAGRRFFSQVKGWTERYEVWKKWHSPQRKRAADSLKDAVKGSGASAAATALVVVGAVGIGLLGAAGALPAAAVSGLGMMMMAGTLKQAAAPSAAAPFVEALNDPELKLNDGQKTLLLRLLTEMKLERKPPVTGRLKETEDVLAAVTSPRGAINSVVLIGPPGVGKTAIPEKIAQALVLSETQSAGGTFSLSKMEGRYLMKLNLGRLLEQPSPAAALDDLMGVLSRFNSESKKTGNRVILFIDEVHQLFEHRDGPQIANLLLEPLRDGEVTLITATTQDAYKKHIESNDGLKRRLLPVKVEESSVDETLRALQGARAYYEDLFGVQIPRESLKTAAVLSKYDQEVFLPGRAFKYLLLAASRAGHAGRRDRAGMAIEDKRSDLSYTMDELAQQLARKGQGEASVAFQDPEVVSLHNAAVDLTEQLVELYRKRAAIPTTGVPVVDDGLIKEEITRWTGVASGQLTLGQQPLQRYLDMEKILSERVVDQPEAISAISRAVRQNKAGLSDPKRPMGVFYLTGPTGSGKTHLTKELARFLFDDPDAVIRVDMTEYMEAHTVSQFKGSPPGYVGYEKGGQLTEKVRRKPYSVVLLDEIEKAHPDVFLILLQILGEGRLTDGQGRLVDFKNTIILMTSNLGMYKVDVESFVQRFSVLQAQLREATALGDSAAVAGLDEQKRALARELSSETKRQAEAVTAQEFKETFPPEFQGRLHAPPIVFNRITPDGAVKIVDFNLKELRALLAFSGHEIDWDPEVSKHIADEGFSVTLGARPLQNALDRLVTQPVAAEILASSIANGQKVAPSHIKLSMDKGAVVIKVRPVEPKIVARKVPAEGLAADVFAAVLENVVSAASAQTGVSASSQVLDRLILQAFAARGEDAGVPAAQEGDAPAAAEPGLLNAGAPLALSAKAAAFALSHHDAERKDPQAKAASQALAQALEGAGYPEALRHALLRPVEDPANPYVGWLKLFIEQAKAMTPPEGRGQPVTVSFEVADSAKVVVRRPGVMREKEQSLMRTHFSGPAPADGAKARGKAELLNAAMNVDGRRLLFDLQRQLAAIPGARLGWSQSQAGVEYWIELPREAAAPTTASAETSAPTTAAVAVPAAAVPAAPAASPAVPAAAAKPAPSRPVAAAKPPRQASAPAPALKDLARQFALDLLQQRDKRGPTVRMAAADLLAAVSTAEDHARVGDWIRPEQIHDRFPEIAAAAMTLARHGGKADEKRLIRAMGYLHFGPYGSDLYRPLKHRLVESLAKILASQPGRLSEFTDRYQEEKDKPPYNSTPGYGATIQQPVGEGQFHRHRNDLLLEALYLALCQAAGPKARALIEGDWQQNRLQQHYDYLKRVDPAKLQALYAAWRRTGAMPDRAERILTVLAAADYGEREDVPKLYRLASNAWGGGLDGVHIALAGAAAARLAARAGGYDLIRDEARRAMRETVSDGSSYHRMMAAVQVIGAAGDASDLPLIDAILRADPGRVDYVHEMTQHEATHAWAALVHRLGLTDRYLTMTAPAPVGKPALPILQAMLADANPLVNDAALETLRLRFTLPAPPPAAGPVPLPSAPGVAAPQAPPRPPSFFAEEPAVAPQGAPSSVQHFPNDDYLVESALPSLSRLQLSQRTRGKEWVWRMARVLEPLLGAPFSREVRIYDKEDGGQTVVWVLRKAAVHAIPAQALSQVAQLVTMLLHHRQKPKAARDKMLAQLTAQGFENIDDLYKLLTLLSDDPQAKMGLDHDPARRGDPARGETEIWLRFDVPPLPAAAAAPAPARR